MTHPWISLPNISFSVGLGCARYGVPGIRAPVPGTPPAPWHKPDIPRISETVPGNRPVSSQEPGCSSKLTTAFQDAYKHYFNKFYK